VVSSRVPRPYPSVGIVSRQGPLQEPSRKYHVGPKSRAWGRVGSLVARHPDAQDGAWQVLWIRGGNFFFISSTPFKQITNKQILIWFLRDTHTRLSVQRSKIFTTWMLNRSQITICDLIKGFKSLWFDFCNIHTLVIYFTTEKFTTPILKWSRIHMVRLNSICSLSIE
jgi:hypothetical protein